MKPQGVVQTKIRTERRQHPRYPVSGSLVMEAYEPYERSYIGVSSESESQRHSISG
jgi:hypothetical protein